MDIREKMINKRPNGYHCLKYKCGALLLKCKSLFYFFFFYEIKDATQSPHKKNTIMLILKAFVRNKFILLEVFKKQTKNPTFVL